MPGVSAEQIARAKEVDLLSYLLTSEPGELRRSGQNEHRIKSHGSLVISNGKWYWNRGGFGGKSALDYLIKVCGMSFVSAVEAVLGSHAAPVSPLPVKSPETHERKPFALPPPVRIAANAIAYLKKRGIKPDIIKFCVRDGSIYESRDRGKAVCVFVGRDENDIPRFAHMRGIFEKYHRDATGSDKRCGFTISARESDNRAAAVFESPIDALSHACLYPELDCHRLSLGGTSDVALTAFLERRPQIDRVSLCLDNDVAGQTAAAKIRETLNTCYPHISATIEPPEMGKDYNEMLQAITREQKNKRAGHRKETGVFIT